MKFVYLFLLIFIVNMAVAHQPDLSSLMIYEQNGKNLLVIKGSLTAFEGEILYHNNQDAYRTPEEFTQLVINHFKNTCFVLINKDTIRFINPKVILGHETTIFAELVDTPSIIKSYYVKNAFFRDMPNNQCELILIPKNQVRTQYILNNSNAQEIKLRIKNNKWEVEADQISFSYSNLTIGSIIIMALCIIVYVSIEKNGRVFSN